MKKVGILDDSSTVQRSEYNAPSPEFVDIISSIITCTNFDKKAPAAKDSKYAQSKWRPHSYYKLADSMVDTRLKFQMAKALYEADIAYQKLYRESIKAFKFADVTTTPQHPTRVMVPNSNGVISAPAPNRGLYTNTSKYYYERKTSKNGETLDDRKLEEERRRKEGVPINEPPCAVVPVLEDVPPVTKGATEKPPKGRVAKELPPSEPGPVQIKTAQGLHGGKITEEQKKMSKKMDTLLTTKNKDIEHIEHSIAKSEASEAKSLVDDLMQHLFAESSEHYGDMDNDPQPMEYMGYVLKPPPSARKNEPQTSSGVYAASCKKKNASKRKSTELATKSIKWPADKVKSLKSSVARLVKIISMDIRQNLNFASVESAFANEEDLRNKAGATVPDMPMPDIMPRGKVRKREDEDVYRNQRQHANAAYTSTSNPGREGTDESRTPRAGGLKRPREGSDMLIQPGARRRIYYDTDDEMS